MCSSDLCEDRAGPAFVVVLSVFSGASQGLDFDTPGLANCIKIGRV